MSELGAGLSWWWITPFVGMLLAIALLPLVAGEWFDRHRSKALVALVFGVPTVVYLLTAFGATGRHEVLATAEEYVSFIILLTALYTVTGGMYLTGNLLGTPRTNTAFLALGTVLANFIGTTGAAMLLVRPLLRTNSERRHTAHIFVFAIFIVCNLGGLLTPLADPPLFLGFLNGVDFWWTMRLLPQWLLANGIVLLVFFVWDTRVYRREEPPEVKAEDLADYEPIHIKGLLNAVFLAGIIGTVLADGVLKRAEDAIHFPFVSEAVMVALIVLSLTVGSQEGRRLNRFTWGPIAEVGIVFAGIFAAMIPALALLEAHGSSIGLAVPWHYFWATGGLSSFLDNAPTYLTFTATALGHLGIDGDIGSLTATTVDPATGLAPAAFLAAISTGAVFMGAMTYIGNAPNFMVRSLAEENGVKMPSFFGYLAYSGLILLPVFALVTVLFFV